MNIYGERHDGDGISTRGIRHIRGSSVRNTPGLLALDSSLAGVLTERYLGFDSTGLLRVYTTLPTAPDTEGYVVPQMGWGSNGLIYATDVVMTSAEAKVIFSGAAKTLVAAPGAGLFLEFCGALLMHDYLTAVYTEVGVTWVAKYTDGAGVAVSQAIDATGFVTAAVDTYTNALPKIDAIVAAAASINQALVLDGEAADIGGTGAGVFRIRTFYRVHVAFA